MLLFEDFDVDKWVYAIEKHSDSNIFTEMGVAGNKKMVSNYMWDVIAKQYYNVYLRIIEKG